MTSRTSQPPHAVRGSRAPAGEAAATRSRMADAIIHAMLNRGLCTDADLSALMFSDEEIAAHKDAAMKTARQDPAVKRLLHEAA